MLSLQFDTQKLIQICKENDVLKIAVFGSFAREEYTEQSDIDLLVELSKPKSLLNFVALGRLMSTV